MNKTLKTIIRTLAGSYAGRLRNAAARPGARSWSQEGEDRILWRIFEERERGFYVDVGAHHPFRFSNTCLFYKAGWNGINVDAMPGSMRPFRASRPRDVNLEVGVSEERGTARFFVFNEPAFNTFDEEIADKHAKIPGWRIERVVDVPLLPLREILDAHCARGQAIDFMSVDAEGRDLGVLRSNDWKTYRPYVVLAESLHLSLAQIDADPCALFMMSVGYEVYAKAANTVFYRDLRHG